MPQKRSEKFAGRDSVICDGSTKRTLWSVVLYELHPLERPSSHFYLTNMQLVQSSARGALTSR